MRAHSIWLRGCPRCGGDLFPEHEALGWNLSCLQCGYTRWLESAVADEEEASEGSGALATSTLEKEKVAA